MSDEERKRGVVAGVVVRGATGGIVVGLSILAVGIILLLDQEDIVHAGDLLRFWPVIIILVGLARVFRSEANSERLWGFVITLFGALFLLSALHVPHFAWGQIWPMFTIGGGLWVLYWSLHAPKGQSSWQNADLNQANIFGGGEFRVISKTFRGGRIVNVFGGFRGDLTEADIEGEETTIEIDAIFGGGELVVPQAWQVVIRGFALFGGHNDETRRPIPEPTTPRKRLIITGLWLFGGINVKN